MLGWQRHRLESSRTWMMAILALASASCTGVLGGEGGGSPQTSPNGSAGSSATGGASVLGGTGGTSATGGSLMTSGGATPVITTPDGCDIAPIAPRIWRLSPQQYKASVAAALGIGDVDLSSAPGDSVDVRTGFANSAEKNYVGDTLGYVLATQSELAATKYADRAATAYPCLGQASLADSCVADFIAKQGLKILRRPLPAEEAARYFNLFKAALQERGVKSAVKVATTAFLMSPNFLFRSELGDASKPGSLDGYEIASALSYALTDGPPSDDLLAAAAAGKLSDPAQRAEIARGLASTPAAREKFADFIYWQLGFYKLDAKRAELGTDVVSGLMAENKAFVGFVLGSATPDLTTLFTSDVAFPNAAVADIYGVTQPALVPTQTKMPPGQRFGLFTQPGWLTATTGPIHRGKLIKNMFLCETIAPPAGVDPAELKKQLPALPEGATEQDAWAAFQDKNKGCAACHAQFQPLGLALENYDSYGKYRQQNAAGKPIHPSSKIVGADGWSGAFTDAGDLIRQIAASDKGKYCFSERYLAYIAGAPIKGTNQSCVARRIAKTFGAAGSDLRELMVATIGDEYFVQR